MAIRESHMLCHASVQRIVMEQNARLLRSKNEKLEKLCRALQAERNQLKKQDKPVRLVLLSSQLCLYTLDSTAHRRKERGRSRGRKARHRLEKKRRKIVVQILLNQQVGLIA